VGMSDNRRCIARTSHWEEMEGLEARVLLSATQIVIPEPLTQSPTGGTASIDVKYSTSDLDNTLTGLGLRVHFDSSKLAWSAPTGVLGTPIVIGSPVQDSADYDSDPDTDMYVLIAWADFNGNWPNVPLPASLVILHFGVSLDPGNETHVRFSASSTASGYAFDSTEATIAREENTKPITPSGTSPANGATGVGLTPTVSCSPFSDPDPGDTHKATRWQMSTSSSFSSLVWDYTDTDSDKTTEAVPPGTLSYSTTYYWRVQYQDSHDAPSSWSSTRSFTTLSAPNVDLVGSISVTDLNDGGPGTIVGPGSPVHLEAVNMGSPMGFPGLTQYLVRLVGGDGYIPVALDGRFEGQMHQEFDGLYQTPTLDDAQFLDNGSQDGTDNLAADTHLLCGGGYIVTRIPFDSVGFQTQEDGPGTGSYLGGNALGGDFVVCWEGVSAETLPVAQVVIPNGGAVAFQGDVAYKWNSTEGTRYDGNSVSLTITQSSAAVFTAEYEVRNQGGEDAGPSCVDFYVSSDPELGPGDQFLVREPVPALASGQSFSGTLPSSPWPGSGDWYVFMSIDPDSTIAETDESNNLASDQIAQHPPTDIGLSNNSVPENQPSGTVVGDLSAADPDVGDTFTYSLVGGTGGTNNASFTISGSQLKTAASFNYEAKNTYSIRVRATDQGGLHAEEVFTIGVANVNEPPAASDSAATGAVNSEITGQLIATDPDGDTLEFAGPDAEAPGAPRHGHVVVQANGAFTYTPDAGFGGEDTFVFTASDSVNDPAEGTVRLTVGRILHLDAKGMATFIDSTGDIVTVKLRGGGTGEILLPGPTGDALTVKVSGTTSKSSLIIATKGRGARTEVGDIVVEGQALKALIGKTTDIAGDVTVYGTLGSLLLGDIAEGHTITIGGTAYNKPAKMVLGRVQDTSLTSQTPIKSLTVTDWLDTDGQDDLIQAPWVGKVATKGIKSNPRKGVAGVAGDFEANVDLSGVGATKATLGSVKIAGDVDHVAWDVVGLLGKLAVRGTAHDSQVRTTGSIKAIALGASEGSDFLAGMQPAVARYAHKADDFLDPDATIKSFKITGLKDAGTRWFFADSNVSAGWIGTVKLLNVNFDNAGNLFGLQACDSDLFRDEIKSVKWRDTEDKSVKGNWPKGPTEAPPDFGIEILPEVG